MNGYEGFDDELEARVKEFRPTAIRRAENRNRRKPVEIQVIAYPRSGRAPIGNSQSTWRMGGISDRDFAEPNFGQVRGA